jgi:type IV secretory pathway TraG/TraD family ATPase VirD4
MKTIIITQLLYNIKKVTLIYFKKNKFNTRNEKKSKEKNKIKNILKEIEIESGY